MNTDTIRDFTLWARSLLTTEATDLLRGVYGLKEDGTFIFAKDLPALKSNTEVMETRERLERLIADEKDSGIEPKAAVTKLVKEVAFTHLNRLVALKMLEHPERRVLKRAALAGYPEPNGFRMYLPEHEADYKLYQEGTEQLNELTESPRDQAYRHFLLWQCGDLAKEVRVLFDPDNLASRLFPRPKVLRQLIERAAADDLLEAWKPGNEETIGWVYQFFIAEEKAAAFKKVFKDKKKFTKDDIPAATQVFTPRWIVKFLVQNSLGRLWLSMHPDSALASQWEYLVPLAGSQPAPALKSIKEVRLLDPATGTMHFGLVAFDLLVGMYREEIANAGKPGWPKEPAVARDEEIPGAILANNLFGIDIDLRAVQLSALALYVRAKAHHRESILSESRLACADVALFRGAHREKIIHDMILPRGLSRQLFDQFCDALDEASMMGSLVRLEHVFQENLLADQLKSAIDEYVQKKAAEGVDESYFANESNKGLRLLDVLIRHYDVVFTNPPYMSNRNMNPAMSAFMKNDYKKSKGDLYSGFIERCSELLDEGGRMAMITQQSFMFISSYEDLRSLLVGKIAIESMAHVGPRAFDEVQGEKVNTTAFVLRRERSAQVRQDSLGVYFRLVKEPDANAKRVVFEQALARRNRGEADPRIYEYRQGDFAAIPGSPWVYWITPGLRLLFSKFEPLGKIAEPRQGLATTDNPRFLRYWWEVGAYRVAFGCRSLNDAIATGKRWFPYMKGGSFHRWYGNQEQVITFFENGRELKAWVEQHTGESWSKRVTSTDVYFKVGITWSKVSSGPFSVRLNPGGFLFDVGGCCAFPDKISVHELVGILNSELVAGLLRFLAPTVNNEVGQIAALPVPPRIGQSLESLVCRAEQSARATSAEDESTYDFSAPPEWPDGITTIANRRLKLAEIERQIDEKVYRTYEVSEVDRRAIQVELATSAENSDVPTDVLNSDTDLPDEDREQADETAQSLATNWIQYAVGIALGRFKAGIIGALGGGSFQPATAAKLRDLAEKDGILALEEGHPLDLVRRVIEILNAIYSDTETERIVRVATKSTSSLREAVEAYLTGEFFRDHVKRYRKRSIYWLIQSPKRNYSLYLFHEKATPDTLSRLRGNQFLGGRINRLQQEQASLSTAVLKGDKDARKKSGVIAEELEDLQEFDRRLESATRVPVKDKKGHDVLVRWEPELDDGVYINAAPLHELLPSWRDVNPKKAWQELAAGEYDWSKTAMRYWPERVLEKCKDNKSYAIAHGLA